MSQAVRTARSEERPFQPFLLQSTGQMFTDPAGSNALLCEQHDFIF